MDSPHKILIIRPDRLGDLILSLPVAETLKINLTGSEVHYLASPYTAPLAPMIDYVDGWLVDKDKNGNRLSLANLSKKIKKGSFDCLIELKPSGRTAAAGFLSGVKLRIGTSRRLFSIFYSKRISVHRKSSGYHQTDLELKHLEFFQPAKYVTDPSLRTMDSGHKKAGELLDFKSISYLVVHPGSGGSAPNWPLEHYRKLAVMIKKELDYEVVITDSNREPPGFNNCLNLGGKTDLESLAAILESADAFISGSTGPLHMADALGASCLSLFANRPDIGPERWGPRRNMDNVVTPPVPCRCTDLEKCRCLEQVSTDEAFVKLKSILKKRKITGVRKN